MMRRRRMRMRMMNMRMMRMMRMTHVFFSGYPIIRQTQMTVFVWGEAAQKTAIYICMLFQVPELTLLIFQILKNGMD
jgi:hypothetical protein